MEGLGTSRGRTSRCYLSVVHGSITVTLLVKKKKKFASPIVLLGTNIFASLEIPGCFFTSFKQCRLVPDFVEKCSRLPSDSPIPETKSLPYVRKICSNCSRLEKFGNELYKFRPSVNVDAINFEIYRRILSGMNRFGKVARDCARRTPSPSLWSRK